MTAGELSAKEARRDLYEVMRGNGSFEEKAGEALELGRQYLDADNGHLARIDEKTDHWEAVVSTDRPGGQVPPGLELDLEVTYCRRTIAADSSIALHDAPNQGWADDPAFEAHGLHCYHGTTLLLDDEPYGTVCFVATDPRDRAFSDGETMFAELVARLLERELEREQHETELTKRANLVNVLNRVLRHNLRNDMTVIKGRAQLMAEQLSDDVNGDIALRKIDELMALSRKARELEHIVGQELERQQVDVVALIGDVVEQARSEFPSASITVESEEDITAALLPSFERAVQEVIENAAKHGGEPPTVTVTVENVPNAVEVSITDNGPGLSEQEREVLKTGIETPLVHGSGLGLWLVHWIVTSHEGSIETTITDEGTTMTISVPRSSETGVQQQVAKLRQARDRYQAAFEDAFEGMVIVDDDARVVEANPEAGNVYGLDRQDLLGRSIPEFLPDGFDFEAAWAEFRGAGRVRDTVTIEGADGVNRTVEYSAVADVVPGQHLIVGRDITERVERERELAQTETVFHQTQDAIFLVDVTEGREFRVQRVNERYEELTGLSNADIQGQTPREVVGDGIGAEIEARYSECVQRRETLQYREEIPVDGETHYWETKLSPVVEDGNVVSLVGAMRDVTDRIEQQRRFEALSNGFPDLCFILDEECVFRDILSCSTTDEKLYVDPDEFLGEPVHDVLPREQAALTASAVEATIETGQPQTFEYELHVPDGTRLFEARTALLSLDIESRHTVSCVVRDITERAERTEGVRPG